MSSLEKKDAVIVHDAVSSLAIRLPRPRLTRRVQTSSADACTSLLAREMRTNTTWTDRRYREFASSMGHPSQKQKRCICMVSGLALEALRLQAETATTILPSFAGRMTALSWVLRNHKQSCVRSPSTAVGTSRCRWLGEGHRLIAGTVQTSSLGCRSRRWPTCVSAVLRPR